MSPNILNVYCLPQQIAERDLAGSTVIVIDLLRASTTICQALASGATDVMPYLEVADALAAAAEANDRLAIVLGGERGGRRIDGFDLDNSPSEYTPAAVRGKRVLLTTTNGTRALAHARQARRIVVGAIVNLAAVVASVSREPRVDILCAGTGGHESREDILAAGAMVESICRPASSEWQTNDAANAARQEWQSLLTEAGSVSDRLAIELRDTPGGRNLLDLGMDDDLTACAQIDTLDIVPELDVAQWRITVP